MTEKEARSHALNGIIGLVGGLLIASAASWIYWPKANVDVVTGFKCGEWFTDQPRVERGDKMTMYYYNNSSDGAMRSQDLKTKTLEPEIEKNGVLVEKMLVECQRRTRITIDTKVTK